MFLACSSRLNLRKCENMITKICYVLTSLGADLYEEMTCISVSLSRRLYPDAEILVLVDEITNINLAKSQSPLLSLACQIVCVNTGLKEPAARSRFVKTSMRQVVDGDFVFLDADALPIRRFDECASLGVDVAAALDLNDHSGRSCVPRFAQERLCSCGWTEPLLQYFNSGVIYMRDSPKVRKFGHEWHKRWEQMFIETGDHRDQPSFNSALQVEDLKVAILPDSFNASVYVSPLKARNAKIIHYWMNASSGHAPANTLIEHLLRMWRTSGQIDWHAVDRAKRWPLSFNTKREVLISLLGPPGICLGGVSEMPGHYSVVV